MEELKKTTLRGEELGHLVYENKDNYIELVQVFVKEDQREKGIGKELLDELIGIKKEKGISKICVVSTTDETQDFGKWLLAMGFKKINIDAPQWCLEIGQEPTKVSVETPKELTQTETSEESFKCQQCEFIGKNANGLRLHGKKHGLNRKKK